MLKKNNNVVAGNVGDGNDNIEEGERKGWLIVPSLCERGGKYVEKFVYKLGYSASVQKNNEPG